MLDTTFIDALASSSPTPGGGGASAYVGALSTALASMVGNLTVGKKKYADVEDQVKASLERLQQLREELLRLVDADAEAFAPLARAYGMSHETKEEQAAKDAALQEALIQACEVPLEIMRQSAAVIEEADFLAHHGSRLALSDVGVALQFARAAVLGAGLNVFINIKSMNDQFRAEDYREQAQHYINYVIEKGDPLYSYVVEHIS